MVFDIQSAWLYAFSSSGNQPQRAFHTVFVHGPREPAINGQAVFAQIALSYCSLSTVLPHAAAALIHSYEPPFGPAVEFHDYKFNSLFVEQCLAVTFELVANGAEAYAVGTVFIFS